MPINQNIRIEPPDSGAEFESMVADYFNYKWGESHTTIHASSGQADDGVDIYGKPPDLGPEYAGVQCKRTQELSESDIEEIIEDTDDFTPKIHRLIIFWSGRIDKSIQEKVRIEEQKRDMEIIIKFWSEIENFFAENKDIFKKYYPGLFLDSSTIFKTLDEFINQESKYQIFSELDYIKRKLELNKSSKTSIYKKLNNKPEIINENKFLSKIKSKDLDAAIIYGEGGSGKSRLLSSIGCRIEDMNILYLNNKVQIDVDDIKDLAERSPAILFIDDLGRNDMVDVLNTVALQDSVSVVAASKSSYKPDIEARLSIKLKTEKYSLQPITVNEIDNLIDNVNLTEKTKIYLYKKTNGNPFMLLLLLELSLDEFEPTLEKKEELVSRRLFDRIKYGEKFDTFDIIILEIIAVLGEYSVDDKKDLRYYIKEIGSEYIQEKKLEKLKEHNFVSYRSGKFVVKNDSIRDLILIEMLCREEANYNKVLAEAPVDYAASISRGIVEAYHSPLTSIYESEKNLDSEYDKAEHTILETVLPELDNIKESNAENVFDCLYYLSTSFNSLIMFEEQRIKKSVDLLDPKTKENYIRKFSPVVVRPAKKFEKAYKDEPDTGAIAPLTTWERIVRELLESAESEKIAYTLSNINRILVECYARGERHGESKGGPPSVRKPNPFILNIYKYIDRIESLYEEYKSEKIAAEYAHSISISIISRRHSDNSVDVYRYIKDELNEWKRFTRIYEQNPSPLVGNHIGTAFYNIILSSIKNGKKEGYKRSFNKFKQFCKSNPELIHEKSGVDRSGSYRDISITKYEPIKNGEGVYTHGQTHAKNLPYPMIKYASAKIDSDSWVADTNDKIEFISEIISDAIFLTTINFESYENKETGGFISDERIDMLLADFEQGVYGGEKQLIEDIKLKVREKLQTDHNIHSDVDVFDD